MATASARTDRTTIRTSESPKFRITARIADVWGYRAILLNLTRKDLRVKYTQSTLGAVWSMLNPILYLAIFSFVFAFVLKAQIPDFGFYLLSGLVVWNLFNGALTIASRSVVDNTSLVKKVYFPKEILPLSSVGVSTVDFLLQTGVLIAALLVFQHAFIGWGLLLVPLAVTALLLFTTALSYVVASLKVRYRDTQHLMALMLMAWFYFTPIVYPASYLQEELGRFFPVYLVLNPIADIVFAFQRAFYGEPIQQGTQVLVNLTIVQLAGLMLAVIVGSLALLWFAWRSFFRLSGDFAEEL